MLLALNPALSAGESIDAQAWLLGELRNLQKIRTIEFVVTREQDFGSISLPPVAPVDQAMLKQLPSRLQMKFIANGTCLRVETGGNTIAFDGTTLRTLRDHGRAFGESKLLPDAPLVAFPHPIIWSYRWARPVKSYGDIPSIQDDANWDALIESARVLENEIIEVSRVDAKGAGYLYEIERGADARLSGWAGYKLPRRELEGRISVVDSVVFVDEEKEAIWIPTIVKFETSSEGYSRIDPATLKVNHEIDPDVFTISRFEAQELLPVSDPAFTSESDLATNTQMKQSWRVVILINIFLVACGFTYWQYRRKSRSR